MSKNVPGPHDHLDVTLLETFAICSRSRSFAGMRLIFYLHLLMQMENMMMNGLADFEA